VTEFRSQVLTDQHDLSEFDCGTESLNAWLTGQALRAQQQGTARTYVWSPFDSNRVVAYYSIAATQVHRTELTSSQAGGTTWVPAYLLARLALDQSLHGQGLGGELLVDAIEAVVRAAKSAAGRLIVVDAIDDKAAAFYRHHDFSPIKGNPLRLVMKIATARQSLRLAEVEVARSDAAELVSMEWRLPDGRVVPVVLSPEEMRRFVSKIVETVERSRPGARFDPEAVLREVLGRDLSED
jgi:predicted N-acetyltransferase YhbS